MKLFYINGKEMREGDIVIDVDDHLYFNLTSIISIEEVTTEIDEQIVPDFIVGYKKLIGSSETFTRATKSFLKLKTGRGYRAEWDLLLRKEEVFNRMEKMIAEGIGTPQEVDKVYSDIWDK